MKKLILLGGIGVVIIIILFGWGLFAGTGIVFEMFPQWIAEVEKIAKSTIEKAKEALPSIKEKAKEVSPEITEKLKGIIPSEEIPEKDVGGEDIASIPRYPNMIRTSFVVKDGKRTISYKGKAELISVIDFYDKEMSVMGFKKKVLSASHIEEVHEYRKGKKTLEFSFKKADRLGVAMTEMVVREL